MLPCITVLVALVGLASAAERCCTAAQYGYDLGCFNDNYPFDHLPLPECPCTLGNGCAANNQEYPHFDLYTRQNQNNRQTFDRETIPSNFVGSRTTHYLVHGWVNDRDTEWLIDMKDELLAKDNVNVVVVGWGDGAGRINYAQSTANVRATGAEIDQVAHNLVRNGGSSHNRMWCIGHSLGGHTCGHAGQITRFDRISGLDPAGPLFEGIEDDNVGLHPGCASFVDVIHTDGKERVDQYGTLRVLGHMDFYPNAAEIQPGCIDYKDGSDEFGFLGCSHGRAVEYFDISINDDCFLAYDMCADEYNIPASCGPCGGPGTVCGHQGYYARGSGINGKFYLTTTDGENENPPRYCEG